jgi:hypothetical protein
MGAIETGQAVATNAPSCAATQRKKSQYASGVSTWLFTLAVIVAMAFGWMQRGEYYVSADHGIGYALGIIGGSMMLLLLLYPLRKRLTFMTRWLQLRLWFRTHMIFGVIGPLCILYHCNFHLGATNSNVALACMALMVISGLVGRFIYAKIHYGLYGQRADLKELQKQMQISEMQLRDSAISGLSAESLARLRQLEVYALQHRGMGGNIWRILTIGFRIRIEQQLIRQQIKNNSQLYAPDRRRALAQVRTFFSVVKRIAGFSLYERLFSYWHVLHMPIFFMLVITGLVHVFAVHMY